MQLMNVSPSFYNVPMPTILRSNAVRMAGSTDAAMPFELDADLVKQLKAQQGKPIYRRLGDDKVVSLLADAPQVAGAKYSLRASILGVKPRSFYQIMMLAPQSEHGNTFKVSSAKDVVADNYAPLVQLHAHVPTLLQVLKDGRAIDGSDFMDVTDGYDDLG